MTIRYRLVRLDGSARTLELSGEAVIGSDPGCRVRIEGADPRHASIGAGPEGLVLRDLGSQGGTFLGADDIEEAELRDGDVIRLGVDGPQLRVELAVAAPAPGATLHGGSDATLYSAAEHTLVPGAGGPPLTLAALARPTPRGPAPGDHIARLRVRFLSGSRDGALFELAGSVLRVGRAQGSDVWTPDDRVVSAQHAKLVRVDSAYILFDLESRNGTFLNGHRVDRAPLAHGDVVGLGPGGPTFAVEFLSGALAGRGDATVTIPDFDRLAARSRGTALIAEHELPAAGLDAGRGPEAGLRLDSPIVSRRHARFTPLADGRVRVEDHASANGTFARGERVSRAELAAGERVVIGPFEIEVAAARLRVFDTRSRLRLDVHGATVQAGARTLVDAVDLAIAPGTFTALIGPSGAGKSTLLEALAGLRPLAAGEVLANGQPLHAARGALVGRVGFVPQQDIVHLDLTVAESLDALARLRLPPDTTAAERDTRVKAVLSALELTERRDVLVRRLSGGQRKRVSIAAELLTEPSLLLLDEPTSGLDPALEESLMLLLRELAYKGKTVVLVTHTLDNLALCDQVVLLAEGRLAFSGPPAQAQERFGVSHLGQLYARLREKPVAEWAERARADSARASARRTSDTPAAARAPARLAGPLRQWAVLSARYARLLGRDRRNLVLLLAQAPVIAVLIGISLLYGDSDFAYTKPKNTILFLLALTSVWFGCSNAAREVVKERAILARERFFGLGLAPYLLSKACVLAAVAAVQCAAFLAILDLWFGVPGSKVELFGAMLLASTVGSMLGLALSALSASADRAMTLLPILLIPQVLFTSPAIHMDMKGPAGQVAHAMPTWWAYDLLRRIALEPSLALDDETLVQRLELGGPVLLDKARFERLVEEGWDVFRHRKAVEMTWVAAWPEQLGASLPAPERARARRVDVAALTLFGLALFLCAHRALHREDSR
ncbi:MAG: FHA domain-containing protein [Vicinamibacteria bacterium]|nr:FHA domain-containing protein [Vicinamibacteria bacterium]